jgi:hypothetical protein
LSDILQQIELDGLRTDFKELLGETLAGAKTTVAITRVTSADRGPINPTTLRYDSPVTEVIYTGPAHISPVTFRRDRQEVAGGEAQRIRQYRCVLPWDSGDVHIDDNLEVVSSSDPQFATHGSKLQVSDVMYESELAARRLTLVDVSGTGDNC